MLDCLIVKSSRLFKILKTSILKDFLADEKKPPTEVEGFYVLNLELS
jgi:hypothetical protein